MPTYYFSQMAYLAGLAEEVDQESGEAFTIEDLGGVKVTEQQADTWTKELVRCLDRCKFLTNPLFPEPKHLNPLDPVEVALKRLAMKRARGRDLINEALRLEANDAKSIVSNPMVSERLTSIDFELLGLDKEIRRLETTVQVEAATPAKKYVSKYAEKSQDVKSYDPAHPDNIHPSLKGFSRNFEGADDGVGDVNDTQFRIGRGAPGTKDKDKEPENLWDGLGLSRFKPGTAPAPTPKPELISGPQGKPAGKMSASDFTAGITGRVADSRRVGKAWLAFMGKQWWVVAPSGATRSFDNEADAIAHAEAI